MFDQIISLDNLLYAWKEFKRGKTKKLDVQKFEFDLESNIYDLRYELKNKKYIHGQYTSFFVRDPKLRHIHKATVRDRVMHQALFRILYPIFDKRFIYDSYSCRMNKGTHRGMRQLANFVRKESNNYSKVAFALKCDIKKFFANIDQAILFKLISRHIDCKDTLWLVQSIVNSFAVSLGRGLPLGNVTSQLFANIYLNELDQFIKRKIGARHYLRYCDDFIILSDSRNYLQDLIKYLDCFLNSRLNLRLHPNKISIRKLSYGIDFLGYIVKPHYSIIRTKTKKRVLKRINYQKERYLKGNITEFSFCQIIESYLGILQHCAGKKIARKIVQAIRHR